MTINQTATSPCDVGSHSYVKVLQRVFSVLLVYGGSQSRGQIGAVATGLHHSHTIWDLSRICDLHHSSQKRQILNLLSEARDQTHNPMVPSQIHFRCATMGAPQFSFLILIIYIFFFLCQPN